MAVKYTVKHQVTNNVWKWEEHKEKLFTILKPMYVGRAPKAGSAISDIRNHTFQGKICNAQVGPNAMC